MPVLQTFIISAATAFDGMQLFLDFEALARDAGRDMGNNPHDRSPTERIVIER